MKMLRVVIALMTLALASSSALAVELDRQFDFNVAAQPLTSAIVEFSKQADVQVLADGQKLDRVESRGVRGRYSIRDGLKTLLDGTGFGFKVVGANTISLTPSGNQPAATNEPTHLEGITVTAQ